MLHRSPSMADFYHDRSGRSRKHFAKACHGTDFDKELRKWQKNPALEA